MSVVTAPIKNDAVAYWTDQVARGLRKNHSIVCYSYSNPNTAEPSAFEGVEYRWIEPPPAYDRYLRKGGKALDEFGLLPPDYAFYASSLYFRHYGHRIAEALQSDGADIIHLQNFSQFAPGIKSQNPRAKLVLHMHADWLIEINRRWVQPRLAATDAIVCCSHYYANGIRKAWPEFADRVHVVYNGVAQEELTEVGEAPSRPQVPRRILFVGRVVPDKGVHILIEAFNGLVEEFPDAELTIVGWIPKIPRASSSIHGSKEPIVRELSAKFGGAPYEKYLRSHLSPAAAERVTITGAIPRPELLCRYRDSDLLVLPSILPEGFGMPIIEAASWGLPTVATRRGGIPEVIVDGETGRLVEAGDARGLRAAIADLLRDDVQRRRMGQAARARALGLFTWSQIVERLEHVYKNLWASDNRGQRSICR
jgi:glycosyltransferase involved in cell wall biosynthesis